MLNHFVIKGFLFVLKRFHFIFFSHSQRIFHYPFLFLFLVQGIQVICSILRNNVQSITQCSVGYKIPLNVLITFEIRTIFVNDLEKVCSRGFKSQRYQQLLTGPLLKYCSQGPHPIKQGPHFKRDAQASRSKGPSGIKSGGGGGELLFFTFWNCWTNGKFVSCWQGPFP